MFYMYTQITPAGFIWIVDEKLFTRRRMMKLKALLIAVSLFSVNIAVASDHCSWYIEDRGWCTPYFPTSDPTPPKK